MYDPLRRFLFLKTTRTAGTNLEFALGPSLSPGSIRTPIGRASRDFNRAFARTEWRPWREVWDAVRAIDDGRALLGRPLSHRGLDRPRLVAGRLIVADLLRGRGPLQMSGVMRIGRQHSHMTAVEARGAIGHEAFATASKMAVVRHPYDHAVSMYFFSLATDPNFRGWGFDDWLAANPHILTWNRDIITIGDRVVVDRLLRQEELPDSLPPHLRELGIEPGPVVERFAANRLNGDTRPRHGSADAGLIGPASRRLIDELCWFEFDELGYERADGSRRRRDDRVISANQAGFDRNGALTEGLPLDRAGIEIAPLYRPIVRKGRAEVLYVDVCSAEESRTKHAGYEHDPIVDIDVLWTPGRRLADCVRPGTRFSWAVASHVLEHVPDPIGWLNQVLEVMDDGAVLSLALPDKHHCFDRFRADTTAAELIDAWVRGQTIPSPRQVFDFVSRTVSDGYIGHDGDPIGRDRFEDCGRSYTDQQALDYVRYTWTTGSYLDVHCSVFSVETFPSLIDQLCRLGILAVSVGEPVRAGSEFIVQVTKVGEPTVRHPGAPHQQSLGIAPLPLAPNEGAVGWVTPRASSRSAARRVLGRVRRVLGRVRRTIGAGTGRR